MPLASEITKLIPDLGNRTIMVVGDVVLDRYILGRAERLSREAPIPVLVHQHSFSLPGSAANPARNIQSLGSKALQVAAVGSDPVGAELLSLLENAGVDTNSVLRIPGRTTCVKERILAHSTLHYPQQLARIDWVDERPFSATQLEALAGQIESRRHSVDAILVSDYQGGVVSGSVLEACLFTARELGMLVCVDAQTGLKRFQGVTCVKCNRDEASRAMGRKLLTERDFEEATAAIVSELEVELFAITRGEEGMSLRHRDSGFLTVPAPNRSEVYDVVGAGDTVIAIMTLGLLARWDLLHLATVSQLGAAIVIQRLGNATPSPEELVQAAKRWL